MGVANAKRPGTVREASGASGERWEGRSKAHSGDDYYFYIWLKIDKLIAEPIVRKLATH